MAERRIVCWLGVVMVLIGCASRNRTSGPGVVYVDDFDLSVASCGLGKAVRKGESVDGHSMKMRGVAFRRGFGTYPGWERAGWERAWH